MESKAPVVKEAAEGESRLVLHCADEVMRVNSLVNDILEHMYAA